jgi:hypothetical protein
MRFDTNSNGLNVLDRKKFSVSEYIQNLKKLLPLMSSVKIKSVRVTHPLTN